MKKLFLFVVLLAAVPAFTQSVQEQEKPYIEVTGTAEREVVPDRIFISIVLREMSDNKKIYTVGQQEDRLFQSIKKLGIDLKNLSLADAGSSIIKYKRKVRGVEERKEYTLLVHDAAMAGRVFEELHNLNIKEAGIARTEHSQIESLRKEVRISAIKAARDKAVYLLQAIGEEPGKPLQVKEVNDALGRLHSNVYSNVSLKESESDNEVSFENMVIKFSYFVKYSIK